MITKAHPELCSGELKKYRDEDQNKNSCLAGIRINLDLAKFDICVVSSLMAF